MVSADLRKGIVIAAAIVILLAIITLAIVLLIRKSPTRKTSTCPTPDPPEFITVSVGPEFPFKAVVSWSSVSKATTYVVYRRSQIGISKTSYDERIFTTGTQVTFDDIIEPVQYFSVAAFNECGEGILSTERKATVVCVFDPPENLDVQSINSTTAQVNWDPVQGATGYHVYVNEVKVFSGNITSTTIQTNLPGNYSVRVSTQNQCGEGPLSNPFILNVPVIFI